MNWVLTTANLFSLISFYFTGFLNNTEFCWLCDIFMFNFLDFIQKCFQAVYWYKNCANHLLYHFLFSIWYSVFLLIVLSSGSGLLDINRLIEFNLGFQLLFQWDLYLSIPLFPFWYKIYFINITHTSHTNSRLSS